MERGQWASRLGFMLAAAGSAVGLGNIWRFPWLVGENGGGVFLVLYLILVFTLGLSVLMAEFAIGRAAQRDVVGAYRILGGRGWPLAGYFGIVAGILILSFYCVVGGWTLSYSFRAATGGLVGDDFDLLQEIFGGFITSPGEPIFWQFLFIALTVFVVMRGVGAGIERWARVLMPVLFLLLVALIIRVLFLPGAFEGIKYLFQPDFSKVTGSMMVTALSQAFFSLSLGMGAMITYGSYLRHRENLPQSSVVVAAVDTGVAILAGLLILPAVFAFGYDPAAGPGLAFVTLPAIFADLPGALVLATAFFVLLAIAALTSSVAILEVATAWLHDELNVSRPLAAVLFGLLVFILGIPVSLSLGIWQDVTIAGFGLFDLADALTSKIMLPLGGMAITILVGWVAWPKIREEVLLGSHTGLWLIKIWGFICRYVAPPAIAIILVAGLVA